MKITLELECADEMTTVIMDRLNNATVRVTGYRDVRGKATDVEVTLAAKHWVAPVKINITRGTTLSTATAATAATAKPVSGTFCGVPYAEASS